MSKFRARQLDASKQIPIYLQEDVSDCSEFNNVTNRTVPQLPTGMEKEEETEHHLQQAIFHHRVIPVPEVYCTENDIAPITYDQLYPPTYKASRQMIHIHPFSADQDIPDYDLDSEDEEWLQEHTTKGELLPLDPLQFEEMMDRLEKASGLKAVTLQEAKLLLKDDDDLITAVYDYWLNKRLRLEHPLIPQVKQFEVKSEKSVGTAPTDPYVAFRKRTEKMQTRKNRKNDETSYEKMLKLKRDLMRAATLLEMVKRREKSKREIIHLNIELYEKRYDMEDFNGAIINEISSHRLHQHISRPAFAPITPNHKLGISDFDAGGIGTGSNLWLKVPSVSRSNKEEGKRERRPYKKKRKHQPQIPSSTSTTSSSTPAALQQLPRPYIHPPDPYSIASIYPQTGISCASMASEDEVASPSEAEDDLSLDGYFAFRRKPLVNYYAPRESLDKMEDKPPPWGGTGDKSKQFYLTSVAHPTERVIGFARRRIGRGGRVWLDRVRHPLDDFKLKSELKDEGPNGLKSSTEFVNEIKMDWPHYHPSLSALADTSEDSEDAEVDVETVSGVPPSPCIGEGVAHSSSHLEDTGGGGKDSAGLPSSFYITAEVIDGSQEGVLTDLHVTLPPLGDIDLLSVMDDGEEVDVHSTGVSGKVSRCHSDTVVTCGGNSNNNNNNNNINNNNNVNSYSDSDAMDSDSNNKGGIHSSTKLTLLMNCDGKNNSRNISVSNSPYYNNNNLHSTFDFQTQPSSKFSFSDITSTPHTMPQLSHHTAGNRQHISTSSLVTGDENVKLLGISQQVSSSSCSSNLHPVSSSSSLLSYSSSSLTSNSSSFSSTNALSSSSSFSSCVKNLSSDLCTTSCSPSLSSVISSSSPKTLSVSSCLATSLSNNSLLCASPTTNISSSMITTKTNTKTNNDLKEPSNASSKKLSNISSLYLRPQKEKFHLDSFPSGLLLTSSKTNGNDVITNSNSNLVSQKILSWTNENLNSEENTSSLITNGPSSKSIDNLKCALFPET